MYLRYLEWDVSKPNSLEIYFTKVGCGMSATREYYHLILTHNFPFSHYFFVYAAGENNVVGLIHPTPNNEDTLELIWQMMTWLIIYEMIFLRKWNEKNGKTCDDYYYSFGKEHEMDNETYSMYDALEQNTIDNIYIRISEPTNG